RQGFDTLADARLALVRRGRSEVPPAWARFGITRREADVLARLQVPQRARPARGRDLARGARRLIAAGRSRTAATIPNAAAACPCRRGGQASSPAAAATGWCPPPLRRTARAPDGRSTN